MLLTIWILLVTAIIAFVECGGVEMNKSESALLIIDVQNCFLPPQGSLQVEQGNKVIPIINALRNKFEVVVLSQDWHCPKHISFASQHPG